MMENEHVLSDLIRKPAGLAGEIDHLNSVVQQKAIELDHLDATIRIFRQHIELEQITPRTVPPRHHALPGEMIRGVQTILREKKAAYIGGDHDPINAAAGNECWRQGTGPHHFKARPGLLTGNARDKGC